MPTPEERLASFDLVGRSAEALQRLKPQELRALWLRAQGHSYNDIGATDGVVIHEGEGRTTTSGVSVVSSSRRGGSVALPSGCISSNSTSSSPSN